MKKCLNLIIILLAGSHFTIAADILASTIMPGTKLYDVNKPSGWGEDMPGATPNNSTDDDAIAINAAIDAAAERVVTIYRNDREVFQQLIYLPAGEYHISTPIVIPSVYVEMDGKKQNRKENAIWIQGDGKSKTYYSHKEGC